jgi:hypothetical protein
MLGIVGDGDRETVLDFFVDPLAITSVMTNPTTSSTVTPAKIHSHPGGRGGSGGPPSPPSDGPPDGGWTGGGWPGDQYPGVDCPVGLGLYAGGYPAPYIGNWPAYAGSTYGG